MKKRTKLLTLCALFTAVLCVCAQIAVPMPSGIAFTLQTFGVALAGFTLGAKYGFLCTVTYIALGAIGVPVFSAFGGGVGTLFGYSGGFLWGLPLFSALCGCMFYVNQKTYKLLLLSFSLLLLHVCGVLWFCKVSGNAPLPSFMTVSLIYLPKDILSLAAAHFTAKRINKFIYK